MITAVRLEKRPVTEVVSTYGVSRAWVYKLLARYDTEGAAAFEPRSRRPRSSPNATPQLVVDRILALRADLCGQGLDAGPHTLVWHLANEQITVSAATVSRILTRHGAVVPDPSKRPKSSLRRFQAELPNETWQSDFTHWRLADGTPDGQDVEILNWLDDHSRYLLGATVHKPVTGPVVVAQFKAVVTAHGTPASVLTDNGLVYTTRFAGGRRGRTTRNGFEQELAALGVQQKNSSPNHPQTCGKVERFHQTLKKFLAKQDPAQTKKQLQAQLDRFAAYYNTERPHRSIGRRTPAEAFAARERAFPTGPRIETLGYRVRHDRVSKTGNVTLRYRGRLHHIGVGGPYKGWRVILLVAGREVRILTLEGIQLHRLVLDPTKDYQPMP